MQRRTARLTAVSRPISGRCCVKNTQMVPLGWATGSSRIPSGWNILSCNINGLKMTSPTLRGPSKTAARHHNNPLSRRQPQALTRNRTPRSPIPALPALNPLFAVWRVYDIDVEMLSLFVAAGETDFDFIRTAEIRAPHDSRRRRQRRLRRVVRRRSAKATGDTGSGDCAWARCASRTPREVRGKPQHHGLFNALLLRRLCCVGSVA